MEVQVHLPEEPVASAEYRLVTNLVRLEANMWAPAGHAVDWEEFMLPLAAVDDSLSLHDSFNDYVSRSLRLYRYHHNGPTTRLDPSLPCVDIGDGQLLASRGGRSPGAVSAGQAAP